MRYNVRGTRWTNTSSRTASPSIFLLSKHPTAKNISKNVAEGTYVVINTFDDEVFQVLSEIADKPAYWILQCQYKKVH